MRYLSTSPDTPPPPRSQSALGPNTPAGRYAGPRSSSVAGRRKPTRTDLENIAQRILTGVRVRPPLAYERNIKDAAVCVQIELPDRVVLTDPQRQQSLAFDCNYAFDSSDPSSEQFATQEDVYNGLGGPIVEQAAQGYNCCLCAYGQTGTGKTHTIHGEWNSAEGRGLLPRIAEGLLSRLEEYKKAGAQVRMHASYIEIYNNKLFDLLSTATAQRPPPAGPRSSPVPPMPVSARKGNSRLEIHTHPTIGVYVDNLSEIAVSTVRDVGRLVAVGERHRHTATTSMNSRSSRSHTIFSFKLEVQHLPDSGPRMATVQVVDLAGRENDQTSECKGERFKELTFINRSLFQLANCVHALSEGEDHVPFRNSKLTMLLSESFQRNSRTHLLATLTPSSSGYEENMLTCRFLESTGRITTQPTVNRYCSEDLQGQLQCEIETMRQELGLSEGGNVMPMLKSRQLLLAHITEGITSVQAFQRQVDARQGEKEAVIRDACQKVGQSLQQASERMLHLASEHEAITSCLGRAESQLQAVEAQAVFQQRYAEPESRSVPEPWDLTTPSDESDAHRDLRCVIASNHRCGVRAPRRVCLGQEEPDKQYHLYVLASAAVGCQVQGTLSLAPASRWS